jgi:hypothetical protein
MVAGFELVAWAVAIPLTPTPWRYLLLALVAAVTALLVPLLWRVLRNPHRLEGESLTLRFSTCSLRLGLAQISHARLYTGALPRGLAPGLMPEYRADDDTLYLLADRKGLVVLALGEPGETHLPKQGTVQFTRVVLTLDEPAAFLAALTAAGVETAIPEAAIPEAAVTGEQRQSVWATAPVAPAPGGAILLDGLSRRFGSFTAVEPISLSVAPGEVRGQQRSRQDYNHQDDDHPPAPDRRPGADQRP